MEENILKGNFKVKNAISTNGQDKKISVREELRSRAMASFNNFSAFLNFSLKVVPSPILDLT